MPGTNKHTCTNTNCIHCSLKAGFFGKLNKVIFPSQPKTHFFGDIVDFVVYKQNDKSFSS